VRTVAVSNEALGKVVPHVMRRQLEGPDLDRSTAFVRNSHCVPGYWTITSFSARLSARSHNPQHDFGCS
jgi:hypothetical protein